MSTSEIKSFPFSPTMMDMSSEEEQLIQDSNKFIFDTINLTDDGGLCSYLCKIGLESFMASTSLNIAFLTVGKVLSKNNNIFNVPVVNVLLKKMKKDNKKKKQVMIGSNIHVWITLENGQIVDPSVLNSLEKRKDVVIGRPEQIYNEYNLEYIPYVIIDFKDISPFRTGGFNSMPIDDFKKLAIISNAQNMKCVIRSKSYY